MKCQGVLPETQVARVASLAAKHHHPAVSKLKRRADMYCKHAPRFPQSPGRRTQNHRQFPEGTVEITQFEDVNKAAAGKD